MLYTENIYKPHSKHAQTNGKKQERMNNAKSIRKDLPQNKPKPNPPYRQRTPNQNLNRNSKQRSSKKKNIYKHFEFKKKKKKKRTPLFWNGKWASPCSITTLDSLIASSIFLSRSKSGTCFKAFATSSRPLGIGGFLRRAQNWMP